MINTFQYKGRTITVSMENVPDGHFYTDYDGEVVHKWIITEPRPNTRFKFIQVEYVHQELTLSGRLIVEHPKQIYIEHNYDFFYNLEVSGKQGEILLWNVLNGLIYRNLGVRAFKVDGSFYQPTVYEVAVTPAMQSGTDQDGMPTYNNDKRIEITTYEGLAPFSFSVDKGLTWQNEPIFENLPPTETVLLAKDADGNINPKTIS